MEYALKLKLWIVGYLLLATLGILRVEVDQKDRVERAVEEGLLSKSSLPSYFVDGELQTEDWMRPRWERAWIWEIGEQNDGSVVTVDWFHTVFLEAIILAGAIAARAYIARAMWKAFRPWLTPDNQA